MTTPTSAPDEADRAVSRASRELHRHGKRSKTRRKLRLVLYVLAGAALMTSTVVTVMFRHDMEEARARLAAQPTEIFQSSYGDIEYRVAGAGPTVLVSHGITGGVDQAEALVTQWRNFQPDKYQFIFVS